MIGRQMGARLVFFELTVKNLDRAKKFYGTLLGWSFRQSPSPDFVSVEGAGIAGGILKVSEKADGDGVKIFFQVDNVRGTLKQAETLGCKVLVPETKISPSRTLAEFRDPEGNIIGIMSQGRDGLDAVKES